MKEYNNSRYMKASITEANNEKKAMNITAGINGINCKNMVLYFYRIIIMIFKKIIQQYFT